MQHSIKLSLTIFLKNIKFNNEIKRLTRFLSSTHANLNLGDSISDPDKTLLNDKYIDPSTIYCCGNACYNCVWIEYANTLAHIENKDGIKIIESDPAVDAFLEFEKQLKLSK